jgi:CDP-2,3-bis-(O-geranylgeranyl)-sn-glycerol synthase
MLEVGLLLLLIGVANTAPLVAKKLLGERWSRPVDNGLRFFDGEPLFGRSKTVRGIVVGVLTPALVAPLVGHPAWQGLVIGGAAMTGDLVSSFVKRRLRRPPSSQAFGLDQIPEALVPALVARIWFDLSLLDILVLLVCFTVLEVVLSKVMFRLRLRDRPY